MMSWCSCGKISLRSADCLLHGKQFLNSVNVKTLQFVHWVKDFWQQSDSVWKHSAGPYMRAYQLLVSSAVQA